jgi:uncharacterized alkaline shock family protein YloU
MSTDTTAAVNDRRCSVPGLTSAGATRSDAAPADAAPVDAETRGATTIADRVVEKIAAQAVAEVDCATGATRRVLGVGVGTTSQATPARVHADVDGHLVMVRVSMSVVWPASVRAVTRQVRSNICERVHTLAGLEVAEVDIDVPTLLNEAVQTVRRLN